MTVFSRRRSNSSRTTTGKASGYSDRGVTATTTGRGGSQLAQQQQQRQPRRGRDPSVVLPVVSQTSSSCGTRSVTLVGMSSVIEHSQKERRQRRRSNRPGAAEQTKATATTAETAPTALTMSSAEEPNSSRMRRRNERRARGDDDGGGGGGRGADPEGAIVLAASTGDLGRRRDGVGGVRSRPRPRPRPTPPRRESPPRKEEKSNDDNVAVASYLEYLVGDGDGSSISSVGDDSGVEESRGGGVGGGGDGAADGPRRPDGQRRRKSGLGRNFTAKSSAVKSSSTGYTPPATEPDRRSAAKGKPAFPGAKFDSRGYCIRHPAVKLQERHFDRWEIFHDRCPLCPALGEEDGGKDDRGGGEVSASTNIASDVADDAATEPSPRAKGGGRGRSFSRPRALSRGRNKSRGRNRKAKGNIRGEDDSKNESWTRSGFMKMKRLGGRSRSRLRGRLRGDNMSPRDDDNDRGGEENRGEGSSPANSWGGDPSTTEGAGMGPLLGAPPAEKMTLVISRGKPGDCLTRRGGRPPSRRRRGSLSDSFSPPKPRRRGSFNSLGGSGCHSSMSRSPSPSVMPTPRTYAKKKGGGSPDGARSSESPPLRRNGPSGRPAAGTIMPTPRTYAKKKGGKEGSRSSESSPLRRNGRPGARGGGGGRGRRSDSPPPPPPHHRRNASSPLMGRQPHRARRSSQSQSPPSGGDSNNDMGGKPNSKNHRPPSQGRPGGSNQFPPSGNRNHNKNCPPSRDRSGGNNNRGGPPPKIGVGRPPGGNRRDRSGGNNNMRGAPLNNGNGHPPGDINGRPQSRGTGPPVGLMGRRRSRSFDSRSPSDCSFRRRSNNSLFGASPPRRGNDSRSPASSRGSISRSPPPSRAGRRRGHSPSPTMGRSPLSSRGSFDRSPRPFRGCPRRNSLLPSSSHGSFSRSPSPPKLVRRRRSGARPPRNSLSPTSSRGSFSRTPPCFRRRPSRRNSLSPASSRGSFGRSPPPFRGRERSLSPPIRPGSLSRSDRSRSPPPHGRGPPNDRMRNMQGSAPRRRPLSRGPVGVGRRPASPMRSRSAPRRRSQSPPPPSHMDRRRQWHDQQQDQQGRPISNGRPMSRGMPISRVPGASRSQSAMDRRPMSRGRPGHGGLGGNRSRSPMNQRSMSRGGARPGSRPQSRGRARTPPNDATVDNSYALVVRERTPSPDATMDASIDSRPHGRNRGHVGRGVNMTRSRGPTSRGRASSIPRSRSRSPPLPHPPMGYNNPRNRRRSNNNSLSSPRNSLSPSTRSMASQSTSSTSPSYRRSSVASMRSTQSQSLPPSEPEIWIQCKHTEEDPFENSFATFEEWSLPPQPHTAAAPRSGMGPHAGHFSPVNLPPLPRETVSHASTRPNSLEGSPPPRQNSLEGSPPLTSRDDSFDDRSPPPLVRRDNSFNRSLPPSMRRLNSFDIPRESRESPFDIPRQSRENSFHRSPSPLLQSWSDHNAQTRSKASSLARISQKINETASSRVQQQQHRGNRNKKNRKIMGVEGMTEKDMTNVQMALKIIGKGRGGKLPRVNAPPEVEVVTGKAINSNPPPSIVSSLMAPGPPPQRPAATAGASKYVPAEGTTTTTAKASTSGGKLGQRTDTAPSPLPRRRSPPLASPGDGIGSTMNERRRRRSPPAPQGHYDGSFNDGGGPSFNDSGPVLNSLSAPPHALNSDGGPGVRRSPPRMAPQDHYDSSFNDRGSMSFNDSGPGPSSVSARSSNMSAAAGALNSEGGPCVRRGPPRKVAPPPPPPPVPPLPQEQHHERLSPGEFHHPHHQHQEYELPMKNGTEEEWRKYQVKGDKRGPPTKKKQQQQDERQRQPQSVAAFQHDGNGGGAGQSWLDYKVEGTGKEEHQQSKSGSAGRSESNRRGGVQRKSKMFGREPRNRAKSERENLRSVKQMPFTDQFGDGGMYTGQVNEEGRPDGKGAMKYENGVFYEGTWTDGCQDEKAASQYGRIRGGFTSWSGKGKSATKSGMVLPWNARKNDAVDKESKTNARGMEWTDLNGDTGRYTGEVNNDRLPHGRGIMKYSFGLIAEGEWVNGVLKEGPQDRMISAAASMGPGGARSVAGASGMSVGPLSVGPMSVGPLSVGPMSVGLMSVGPMSVGPMSVGQMQPMQPGGFPMGPPMQMMQHPPPMHFNPMIGGMPSNATQHAHIAQQNAMRRNMYGGHPMMPPHPMQMQMPMAGAPPNLGQLPHSPMPGAPQTRLDKPPISEINIGN